MGAEGAVALAAQNKGGTSKLSLRDSPEKKTVSFPLRYLGFSRRVMAILSRASDN